jgi:hypothetical protein
MDTPGYTSGNLSPPAATRAWAAIVRDSEPAFVVQGSTLTEALPDVGGAGWQRVCLAERRENSFELASHVKS